MELTIDHKNENKLLARTDVSAHVSFEKATPSNADVQAGLAKSLGVDKGHVVVQRITTSFGRTSALVSAHVYQNKEDIIKLEPKVARKMMLDKKNAKPAEGAEAPKAEEKPKEAPAKEKAEPKEEAAEEKPKEEKKAEPEKAPAEENKEHKTEEKKEHHDKHKEEKKAEHHKKEAEKAKE